MLPNPSKVPPTSTKALNQHLNYMDVFATLKPRCQAEIWIVGFLKTSEHVQIKIKMPNPGQEPLAYSKVSNEALKDKNVLFIFKIKIESKFGT